MAMNKKEQAAFEKLTEEKSIREHMANALVQYPPLFQGDGICFQINGFDLRYQVRKGNKKGDNWYEILPGGKESLSGSRIMPGERLYNTESDAYLAIYCRMRDAAAREMSQAWNKCVMARRTDQLRSTKPA